MPASAAAAVYATAAPTLPQPQPTSRPSAAVDPFAASQQLALARHLSTATNGAAPLAARLESLSWLVFQCGRHQNRTISTPHDPAAWLSTPETLALLEQVYLVGGAVADLGVADGVYGGAGGALASNGQRAVVSLDFAALLTRYLGQHGMTLREAFVAEIPYDWLQAKAIHVSSCLETRCTVHRLVFERLVDRVGLEGVAGGHPAAAWGGATIINHNTTTAAAQGGSANAAATAAPVQHGGGPLQTLFFAVWALAGGAVRFVAAIFVTAGGFLTRLVVLRWFASAIGAVAAVANAARGAQGPTSQPQMQPAWAAAAPAAWPAVAPAAAAPQPPPTHSSALPGPQSHPLTLGSSGRTLSSEDEQQPTQQQQQQQQQGQVPYFEALRPTTQPVASPFPIAGALGLVGSATAAVPLLPHHAALREQRKLSFGGQDSFDEDDWGR